MRIFAGILCLFVSIIAFIYGGVIMVASDSKNPWIWLFSFVAFGAGIYFFVKKDKPQNQ